MGELFSTTKEREGTFHGVAESPLNETLCAISATKSSIFLPFS